MPAQWSAGDRPVLGPDNGAISGNWLDWRPDRQSGMSAALSTTAHNARDTDSQRRAPGGHATKSVAGADVVRAGHTGNGYANTCNAYADGKWGSLRQWGTGHYRAAAELSRAEPCASIRIFQRRFVTWEHAGGISGNNARLVAGRPEFFMVPFSNSP
ncbi:MAG: hypothetical protein ABSG53_02665 [Thermoguttaceae bacterium]|jgi:hypothetical protein